MNQSLLGQVGPSHSPVIDRPCAVLVPRRAVISPVLGAALDRGASRVEFERALLRALAKPLWLDCGLPMRSPTSATPVPR